MAHRGPLIRLALAGAFILVILGLVFAWGNSRATAWVEGPGFHEMLNRATSKGLKLHADYAPVSRIGLLGMHVDSFNGTDGERTMVKLEAKDITGWFNPFGIAFRNWEIDDLHIKSGTVHLQKTDVTPGAKAPWMPWWGIFWPYRVQLQDVKCDDANILWELNGKESGIYGTFLEIMPNGHDFEYDARGGTLKTPMTPPLDVRHAHMLIRKPRLYCSTFILGDDKDHPNQQLRLTGEAGLQEDRSMDLKIDLDSLNVSPWLPKNLQAHVSGHTSGHFEYRSTGTGLETGKGRGHLAVAGAVLSELKPIRQYITITQSPDPGDLKLKVCETDVLWEEGALTVENLRAECEGVFQLHGTVTIARDKTLSGTLELGLTDPYLHWLPTAKEKIFTRAEGEYHFTTVHLSGTSRKPQQDLTERVSQEIGPLLAIKLFFNAAGDWFNFDPADGN